MGLQSLVRGDLCSVDPGVQTEVDKCVWVLSTQEIAQISRRSSGGGRPVSPKTLTKIKPGSFSRSLAGEAALVKSQPPKTVPEVARRRRSRAGGRRRMWRGGGGKTRTRRSDETSRCQDSSVQQRQGRVSATNPREQQDDSFKMRRQWVENWSPRRKKDKTG